MKICHVIESASGGSAAILASLALHGVRNGHEVSVIYSPDRADETLIATLKDGGCKAVRPTQMRRSVGPWDAVDGLQLRRTLAALGRLDVIHSHSSKAGALARAFGRFRGTVQIYSPHGFYTMTGEAPFYIGPVERALSLLTDRIVAVSDYEKRHAIEVGISPSRVSVVENGIAPYGPLPRPEARQALGLSLDTFAIGFVGRLAAQKDPVSAVRVAQALPSAMDATLAIIGDGELRAAAEAEAQPLGNRVLFCGPRNAKPLFSAFDCLLCTSRYEGMPVAFLEALHCGVPIVAYPVGGSEELVRGGSTGFVTAADPTECAAAITRLQAMSAGERARIDSACRALAAQHTDETMGNATLDLYREAIAARRD